MRKVWSVFKKEIKIYFISPLAYVLSGIFLLITGYFFYLLLSAFSLTSMRSASSPYFASRLNLNEYVYSPFFHNAAIILLLIIPVLTMRLFAEEKRSGTEELLFTLPLSNFQIIMGKYLAALAVLTIMILCTAIYGALPFFFAKPELPPVLAGYLGLFLLGAAFLSFGLFASSLTGSQIVSAVITFGILMLLWVLSWLGYVTSSYKELLEYLSFFNHFDNMIKGVIDTRDVVYYLSVTFLGVFLTYGILEFKRWR